MVEPWPSPHVYRINNREVVVDAPPTDLDELATRRREIEPWITSREVTGNGGQRRYRALGADRAAWQRARRPKSAKLVINGQLRAAVEDKLAEWWSPQQISGWLLGEYPSDSEMWVSHETIYLSLFVQGKGALRHELRGRRDFVLSFHWWGWMV